MTRAEKHNMQKKKKKSCLIVQRLKIQYPAISSGKDYTFFKRNKKLVYLA